MATGLAMSLAAGAQAESASLPDANTLLAEGVDIPLAEWRALTRGRTVWYFDAKGLFGREHYRAGSDEVTFQLPGGACLEASWRRDGPLYCFDFRDGPPHCFRHLRFHGEVWVLGVGGAVQKVERIDRAPLACGPAQMS